MVKIIDCTIREGGHLNGWNFDNNCVIDSYLASMKSGTDYFEIGYRCDNLKPEWGNYAKCEDNFLFNLFKDIKNPKLSVMIDAGKCSSDKFIECRKENTLITLVRVATYPDKLDIALKLTEDIKNKGYKVILNLMAISEFKDTEFDKIKAWKNKGILETICFADSFGSFLPNDVKEYYIKLKNLGFKNISFHAHNNLQLAFANSIEGIKNNFYSLDASIYGMGRGAGILPLEILIGYLSKNNENYNPISIIKIIEKYYIDFQKNTPWGYNILALTGGLKNIHPYYVRELFLNKNMTVKEIYEKADLIKKNASISYNSFEIKKYLS